MILEIVLTAAVIIGILLLVGVPLETVIFLLAVGLFGLVALAMTVMIVFFVAADISLLFRRYVKGTFLRVDDSGRYDRAVYRVNGEEYTCLFPAESVGRKQIYKPDREYSLLIPRSAGRKSAFDRHSLFIIAIGTGVSVIFVFLLLAGASFFRGVLLS